MIKQTKYKVKEHMKQIVQLLSISLVVLLSVPVSVYGQTTAEYYDYDDAYGDSYSQSYEVEEKNDIKDPFEPLNRAIYKLNDVVDKILLRPTVKIYRAIIPEIGRKGVRNVLRNLTEPVTFANAVMQGDQEHSFTTFWRFFINSTFGIGGIFDVAELNGLKHRSEDFGQTLGAHGSKAGPYIVIPLLGPSNARDAIGKVVDVATDPFNYIFNKYISGGRYAASTVDARDSTLDITEEVEKISFDPYATIRSLYHQKRNDDIKDGKKSQ